MTSLGPFILFAAIALITAGSILVITWLIGGRHKGRARDEIFESGIVPTGGARIRYPVKFFRIALFFLIFDLEVAFILIWAYVFKQAGWWGFGHMTVFIALLFVALIYPWLKGGLDFVTYPTRGSRRPLHGQSPRSLPLSLPLDAKPKTWLSQFLSGRRS